LQCFQTLKNVFHPPVFSFISKKKIHGQILEFLWPKKDDCKAINLVNALRFSNIVVQIETYKTPQFTHWPGPWVLKLVKAMIYE